MLFERSIARQPNRLCVIERPDSPLSRKPKHFAPHYSVEAKRSDNRRHTGEHCDEPDPFCATSGTIDEQIDPREDTAAVAAAHA
jgi:hypothetical protein